MYLKTNALRNHDIIFFIRYRLSYILFNSEYQEGDMNSWSVSQENTNKIFLTYFPKNQHTKEYSVTSFIYRSKNEQYIHFESLMEENSIILVHQINIFYTILNCKIGEWQE